MAIILSYWEVWENIRNSNNNEWIYVYWQTPPQYNSAVDFNVTENSINVNPEETTYNIDWFQQDTWLFWVVMWIRNTSTTVTENWTMQIQLLKNWITIENTSVNTWDILPNWWWYYNWVYYNLSALWQFDQNDTFSVRYVFNWNVLKTQNINITASETQISLSSINWWELIYNVNTWDSIVFNWNYDNDTTVPWKYPYSLKERWFDFSSQIDLFFPEWEIWAVDLWFINSDIKSDANNISLSFLQLYDIWFWIWIWIDFVEWFFEYNWNLSFEIQTWSWAVLYSNDIEVNIVNNKLRHLEWITLTSNMLTNVSWNDYKWVMEDWPLYLKLKENWNIINSTTLTFDNTEYLTYRYIKKSDPWYVFHTREEYWKLDYFTPFKYTDDEWFLHIIRVEYWNNWKTWYTEDWYFYIYNNSFYVTWNDQSWNSWSYAYKYLSRKREYVSTDKTWYSWIETSWEDKWALCYIWEDWYKYALLNWNN